jgi:ribonuclease P protein component
VLYTKTRCREHTSQKRKKGGERTDFSRGQGAIRESLLSGGEREESDSRYNVLISVKKILSGNSQKSVIVISKKVAPKASDRNLVRRRIRSIIHPFEDKKSRFFIVAKPGASGLSFKELQREVESQIKRKTL